MDTEKSVQEIYGRNNSKPNILIIALLLILLAGAAYLYWPTGRSSSKHKHLKTDSGFLIFRLGRNSYNASKPLFYYLKTKDSVKVDEDGEKLIPYTDSEFLVRWEQPVRTRDGKIKLDSIGNQIDTAIMLRIDDRKLILHKWPIAP